jgi:hypothetical protein
MGGNVSKIAIALIWLGGCIAAGCGDDSNGSPDGGGGAGGGGTGGSGGSGAITVDAGGDTGSLACPAEAPTECPTPAVTFGTVEKIFEQRCGSICHNGTTKDPNGALIWALSDYDHIASWQDDIRDDMHACLMPPADAGVPITIEERRSILEWIRCGAKQ